MQVSPPTLSQARLAGQLNRLSHTQSVRQSVVKLATKQLLSWTWVPPAPMLQSQAELLVLWQHVFDRDLLALLKLQLLQ